jgi:hypothetical protein
MEAQMTSIPSLVPRDRYAALERCTYLNQASLGLIPAPAIDAMETFLKETAQFGNLYLTDEQEAAILDGVRSAGAEALGTSSDAVAVVAGAGEGLGQMTSLLEPEHGTILLVGSDFPSVTYPWLAAAQRREISLRFIEDRADRDLTQDLVDAIEPATAVVAFGVVQYATGTRPACAASGDAPRGSGRRAGMAPLPPPERSVGGAPHRVTAARRARSECDRGTSRIRGPDRLRPSSGWAQDLPARLQRRRRRRPARRGPEASLAFAGRSRSQPQ